MIAGKSDQLAGKLQEAYGYSKEEAEREIGDWASGISDDAAGTSSTTYRGRPS